MVAPVVDVVVLVYNEARTLESAVRRLHGYLTDDFPFSWRITIVDNASTDDTWSHADRLARGLPRVRASHLDRKGRGFALRSAWGGSDADVVAYMDVDLSTDLGALLPLVSRPSDVAIGSRLAPGSHVARDPKRELISREIHYFIAGGGGPGGGGPGGGGPGGGSGGSSSTSIAITQWVQRNLAAQTVGGTTIYDLSSATSTAG